MFPAAPAAFYSRAQAMLRASVAEFGGMRAASRALGIPITTLRWNVLGRVHAPSAGTVERLAGAFRQLPATVQARLMGGTDFFLPLPVDVAQSEWARQIADRGEWEAITKYFNDLWHGEQRRREQQGAPPQSLGSP